MVPPQEKQDTGAFNSWLSNLAKPAGGPAPARPQAPGAAPQAAKPKPQGGGVLGDVDGEIDDIFGRIVSEEQPQPFGAYTPPSAPVAAAPIRPAQPQPAYQQTASAPMPPAAPRVEMPSFAPPPRPMPAPPAPPQAFRPQPVAPRIPPVPTFQPLSEPQGMPMMDPSMIGAQIEGAVAEAVAGMQQQMESLKAQHQAELQQAVIQTKNELAAQVKDLQTKFQEQRQKWEKILNDLRSRNDDLLKANQEMEQQVASLRERHSAMIQEYADLKSKTEQDVYQAAASEIRIPGPVGLAPDPSELSLPHSMAQPAPMIQPEPEIHPMPEVKIEMPASELDIPARVQPKAALDIPKAKEEKPDDNSDLMAELEALELEMKKLKG